MGSPDRRCHQDVVCWVPTSFSFGLGWGRLHSICQIQKAVWVSFLDPPNRWGLALVSVETQKKGVPSEKGATHCALRGKFRASVFLGGTFLLGDGQSMACLLNMEPGLGLRDPCGKREPFGLPQARLHWAVTGGACHILFRGTSTWMVFNMEKNQRESKKKSSGAFSSFVSFGGFSSSKSRSWH